MNTFHLTIATPNGKWFEGDAVRLDVRGSEGFLAIMAGHCDFVTTVVPSELTVLLDDDTKKTAVCGGGILTVANNNAVFTSISLNQD